MAQMLLSDPAATAVGLSTESAFGRLARECWNLGLCLEELRASGQTSTTSLISSMKDELHHMIKKAAGVQGQSRNDLDPVMSPVLRACWRCMTDGFHSVLFQFLPLRSCPVHFIPLSCGCPKCGAVLKPRVADVVNSPFHCPACGDRWLARSKPRSDFDRSMVSALLADRLRDLARVAAAECSSSHAWRRSLETTSPWVDPLATEPCEEQFVREAARWHIWPAFASARWPRFPQLDFEIPDWDPTVDCWERRHAPVEIIRATRALRFLASQCVAHHADSFYIRSRLGLAHRVGVTVVCHVSRVAVALHHTMGRYAMSTCRVLGLGPDEGRVYADIVWNGTQRGETLYGSPQGNARLIESEIFGHFAASLCRADGTGVWNQPEPRNFLPTWMVDRAAVSRVLHWRPRATSTTVRRLIRRYARSNFGDSGVSVRELRPWYRFPESCSPEALEAHGVVRMRPLRPPFTGL